MTLPRPGQTWQEAGARVSPGRRRLVHIVNADEHFVEADGRWQSLTGSVWQDSPRLPRRTRVRTNLFVRRYTVLEETS